MPVIFLSFDRHVQIEICEAWRVGDKVRTQAKKSLAGDEKLAPRGVVESCRKSSNQNQKTLSILEKFALREEVDSTLKSHDKGGVCENYEKKPAPIF